MSWTFTFANWSFELDWQGLTVTPLAPQARTHHEVEPETTVRPIEPGQPPALDEGKTQVWA